MHAVNPTALFIQHCHKLTTVAKMLAAASRLYASKDDASALGMMQYRMTCCQQMQ